MFQSNSETLRELDRQLTEMEMETYAHSSLIPTTARSRKARASRFSAIEQALVAAYAMNVDPDYVSPSGKLGVL